MSGIALVRITRAAVLALGLVVAACSGADDSTGPDTVPGSDTDSGSDSGSDSEVGRRDSDSDTETDSVSDTDTDSDTVSDTDTDSDADSDTVVVAHLTDPSRWAAHDTGLVDEMPTDGYFGAVFDGRYVYFVPCGGNGAFHARVLRLDTTAEFRSTASWSAYDAAATDGLTTVGYAGGVFDGRYVYFVPFTEPTTRHGRVLRHDTTGDFHYSSSWSAFDAGSEAGLPAKGFVGAVFDGRYIYFSPFGYDPFAHGRVVRYDTTGDFHTPASWAVHDAAATGGLDMRGFYGLVYDGRHVYFVPFHDGTAFHGRVLRYDTAAAFDAAASWTAYDAGATGGLSTKGYKMGAFDGRYVYFAPFRDDAARHGRVLRHDTSGEFANAASWSVHDAGATDGLTSKGYVGAVFDGRHLLFVPYSLDGNVFHATFLSYDTQAGFQAPASWSAYDADGTDGLATRGYKGAEFDGRYVYFAPYHDNAAFSGKVLRFDALGP